MTYAVYRFYDAAGRLLYVGATKQLQERIGHHKRASSWYVEVAEMCYQLYDEAREAAHAEWDANTHERPTYNRRMTKQLYTDATPKIPSNHGIYDPDHPRTGNRKPRAPKADAE